MNIIGKVYSNLTLKKGFSQFKIFISILLILIGTTCIVAVSIYSYYYNTSLEEINDSESLMMRQNLSAAENRMNEVIQRTTFLVFDDYVNGFIYSDKNTYDYPQYIEMAVRIDNAITRAKQESDVIDSIYIYFRNSNIVLSDKGKIKADEFYEKSYIEETIKRLESNPTNVYYIDNRHYAYSEKLRDADYYKGNIISIVRPCYYANNLGFIIINIRNDKLFDITISGQKEQNADAAYSIIVDGENDIIYENLQEFPGKDTLMEKINKALESKTEGYYNGGIGNKKYLFVYTAENRFGWKNISCIPYTELYRSIYIFRNVLIILTLVIIFMSFATSYIISDKLYKPIKNLYGSLRFKDTYDSAGGQKSSELDTIKFYIDRISDENIEIHRKLSENVPLLKEVFLQQLMMGRVTDIKKFGDRSDFFDLISGRQKYAVYIILIDKWSSHSYNYDNADHNLVKFAVFDSSVKAAGKNTEGMYVISDPNIVTLLKCLPLDEDSEKGELKVVDIARSIRNNILKDLKLSVTISIGIIANDFKEIVYSYFSAKEALNYKVIYGNGSIINSSDINSLNREKYLYPFENEKNLILYINECNTVKTTEAISLIFKEIKANDVSYKFIQQLTIQLLNTIHRFLVEKNIKLEEVDRNINLYDELNTKETVDDMEVWFIELSSKIIDILLKGKVLKEEALISNILEFSNLNFCGNINLEIAAEHFNMSRQYFSKYFTDHMRIKYNDYLNNLRLEKAKKLLFEEDLVLNDISEKSGFNSTQYFIKLFKNKYLVTPSQFREENNCSN